MGAVRPAQVMDKEACASGGGEVRNDGGPLTLVCTTRILPLHRRLDVFLARICWQTALFIRRLSSMRCGQIFVGLYLKVMSSTVLMFRLSAPPLISEHAGIPQLYLDVHSTIASGQEDCHRNCYLSAG
jgi:hypothetical protein